jgi:hypothetical protein
VRAVRPGWYVQRLRALLGVLVPSSAAPDIYRHLMIHKWLLSEQAGHDVGIEGAAQDWLERYHRPLIALLDSYLDLADRARLYQEYAAILEHTWQMAVALERAVPVEEGALDYMLVAARAGSQVPADPTGTNG